MLEFIKKLWILNRPYKGRLALGILCGMVSGFAEPLLVLTLVCVFRVVFPSAQDNTITKQIAGLPRVFRTVIEHLQNWLPVLDVANSKVMLVLVVSTIPGMMLIKGVMTYLNAYLLTWVSTRAISDLRIRVFDHLINLPLNYITTVGTGELMSRVGDVGVLQNMISSSLLTIVRDPITLVSYAVALVVLQPKLTLVALLVFPICIAPIAIYSRKVRQASGAIQSEMAGLSKLMYESFSGNRIVKAYNLEGKVVEEFRASTRKFISQCMRGSRASEIPGPLLEVVGAIGVAIMFLFVARSGEDSSKFLGFVLAIFGMYRPFKSIIRLNSQLVAARAASERVFQMLATQSTILDPPNPVPLQASNMDIHFDAIDFAYKENLVLHHIQFTIKAGQMVALVGASGSGKTTLTNLLLRFYDPQKGAVRIGNTDIRQVAQRDLRAQIAVVTQETVLFNDTIRSNIALGRPGASNEEIEAAARHAYAHDFILETSKGYDTVIGEKGMTLSGGQRQRLAIARAILKNAPILVLDEATNALDAESERLVQSALDDLMHGRTTLCIAHRLSTVQNADVIIVMDQGRIVEVGRHTDLITRGGHYQKLYDLQFHL